MSVNDQYALNWSNHTNHIKKAFDSLLAGSEFVDVTLSCEGKKITAHKMLLSACSTYFLDLFRDNPCQHPIVILKDVKFQNLVDILKFMYNGEVSVATENFDSFLKTAELLQVSGLTDDDNRYGNNEKEDEASENSRVSFVEHLPDQTSSNSTVKKSVVEKPREKETSKKRSTDINIEKSTSHKKRKESEAKPDMEIKQEGDVNFEEDNVQIRDPLEIDQHGDTMEGMELLQPDQNFEGGQDVLSAPSQKFEETQDVLSATIKMELSTVEQMKQQFNARLLRLISEKALNSTLMSREKYDELITHIIQLKQKTKGKTPSDIYKLKRFDVIKEEDGSNKLIFMSSDKLSMKYIVASDELFDVIHETHLSISHGGRNKMEKEVNKKYKNITRETIMLYINLCEVCQRKVQGGKKVESCIW